MVNIADRIKFANVKLNITLNSFDEFAYNEATVVVFNVVNTVPNII